MIQTVKSTKNGLEYLLAVLKIKARTITRVAFWKIPHDSNKEDICLKIGRYKINDFQLEQIENNSPKSELTLDNEEFESLLDFIKQNYEPFKQGFQQFIPIEEAFDKNNIEHIKALFNNPDKSKVVQYIARNDIFPDDLMIALQNQNRIKVVKELESMLDDDLTEHEWQKWFTDNSWILGTEFVRVLDERSVDVNNITDYLMEAYDGFLDIVELKRPGGNLKFWEDSLDHGNYVAHSDLIKAVTQSTKYIYEVERETNSVKFIERVGIKAIKPRAVLVFGRSNGWNENQCEAYRLLNASFHNLTILTYDHVLARAKRIVGIDTNKNE